MQIYRYGNMFAISSNNVSPSVEDSRPARQRYYPALRAHHLFNMAPEQWLPFRPDVRRRNELAQPSILVFY